MPATEWKIYNEAARKILAIPDEEWTIRIDWALPEWPTFICGNITVSSAAPPDNAPFVPYRDVIIIDGVLIRSHGHRVYPCLRRRLRRRITAELRRPAEERAAVQRQKKQEYLEHAPTLLTKIPAGGRGGCLVFLLGASTLITTIQRIIISASGKG